MTSDKEFNMEELDDVEREELARLVGEGYTNGRMDSEETCVYWEIRWNKWRD
jgi:hypothetical protein